MTRFDFAAVAVLTLSLTACSSDSKPEATREPGASKAPGPSPVVDQGSRLPWRLIGARLDDPVVHAFLAESTCAPEREDVPGYGTFLGVDCEGIDFSADPSGTITTVIVYGPASGRDAKYSGPLPRSLDWNLSRRAIEQLLGEPSRHSLTRNPASGLNEYYAEYPDLGLYLNYAADSESDPDARLIDIRIKND